MLKHWRLMHQLIKVNLQENVIDLRFHEYWYQEEIENLYNSILSHLEDVSLLESTLGADRHNYRILWNNLYLIINFDCYSQSCWIEAETEEEQKYLHELASILKKLND